MNRNVPLAACLSLLLASPAFAQNAGPGGPAATATGEQTAASPADANQTLSRLAQDALMAQQIGYLAADKNMQAGYALLGDQVAMINSQINRQIDRLVSANNLALPREMDAQSRERFEAMKNLNKERFAENFVAFVQETYPRMISGIEGLSRQAPNSAEVATLNREAVPALRDQMRAAQQLAQGGQLDPQSAEQINRGPIQRKDDPAVIPDTTAPNPEPPR